MNNEVATPSSLKMNELMARIEKIEARLASAGKPYEGEDKGALQQYCSQPQVPERTFRAEVSPYRKRLLRLIGKKWVNGTKLRYYFLENGPYAAGNDQKDLVRQGFEVWKNVGIGISFEEVMEISEAEIRIGFLREDGAWSYVGRDVIDLPGQYERTMNFGWDLRNDPRGVDTPVYEMGHTLGFPHEHQNPFAGIEWDEEAVYRYFGGPPNNWTRETTRYNVLRKLPENQVEGSIWDPDSIMHYAFPAGLIQSPEQYNDGLSPKPGLSDRDIEQVRLFYPPLEKQYPELKPFHSEVLTLAPAEQKNFTITPSETRDYTLQTFEFADTVMVLFEDQNGDLKYVDGDDDSGMHLNARIKVRLNRANLI